MVNELEEYFNIDFLNELAINEKIYYSPSVGWDKINSKRVNSERIKILKSIVEKIDNEEYRFVPYKVNLLIKNKNSKPRKTCVPTIKDRIVISAVKKYLYDKFEGETFNIPANKIIKEVAEIIKEGKLIYYKKIDLSSFFDNINHDILLEKISKKIDNKKIFDLVIKILKNPQKVDETDPKEENILGVPQGISIATLLSNIYMHDLDIELKNNKDIKYYRYIDDIIIFAENKEIINELYKKIEYDLQRRKLLVINENKTKEGKITDGLEYLGYKFEGELISVRKSSILKFERNIEEVFKNFYLLPEKDDNQIKKFIWLLNIKITGILVDGKKYGWLYYFSCINDKTLLNKMDILVNKFIKRFKIERYIDLDSVKKFTKAYYEINFNMSNSTYLLNLNKVNDDEKKKFLKEICLLEGVEAFSTEELDYRYRYNLYRTLKNLEKDIDQISG